MFLLYLGKMYKPMRDLSKMTDTVSKAAVSLERIREVLETESGVRDVRHARKAGRFKGRIGFDTVSFAYNPDQVILKDVSFEIEAGQVAAFVGPTGGGKSTIINLVARFYDPVSGTVSIDGTDIRRYTMKSVRDQISFVLQETLLFHAPIWQNIAYGRPEATRAEIIRAAELANADEFIRQMPEGYDTMVGERGVTLSGGQRQRVAIARAIIRDTPILVMDEPTSGLDAQSEQLVFEALRPPDEGQDVDRHRPPPGDDPAGRRHLRREGPRHRRTGHARRAAGVRRVLFRTARPPVSQGAARPGARLGHAMVKLLIQPQDGIAALLSAIKKAKTSIDIVIFRFDRAEIETALMAAVRRGVAVSALIAYANRGGEKQLRKLEMRLLEAGVNVSRTPAKLVRYHNKMMIVDRRVLFVLSFNFTHLDIDHSRAFGIVTRKPKLVQEAMKLFEADSQRKTYKAGLDTFIVSPVNARKQLAALIHKAKKELLIYDPNISDTNMAKALVARAGAGVKIRVDRRDVQEERAHRRSAADRPPVTHAHHHLRPARSVRGQPEPARPRAGRTTRAGCHRPRSQDGEQARGHLRGGLVGQRAVRESRGHCQGSEESREVRGGGADLPESDCQAGRDRCGREDRRRGSGSGRSAGEHSESREGSGARAGPGNHERGRQTHDAHALHQELVSPTRACRVFAVTSPLVGVELVHVPYVTEGPPHLLDDLHVVECRFQRVGGRVHGIHRCVTRSFGGGSCLFARDARRLPRFPQALSLLRTVSSASRC